jgi:hypothetical protein
MSTPWHGSHSMLPSHQLPPPGVLGRHVATQNVEFKLHVVRKLVSVDKVRGDIAQANGSVGFFGHLTCQYHLNALSRALSECD